MASNAVYIEFENMGISTFSNTLHLKLKGIKFEYGNLKSRREVKENDISETKQKIFLEKEEDVENLMEIPSFAEDPVGTVNHAANALLQFAEPAIALVFLKHVKDIVLQMLKSRGDRQITVESRNQKIIIKGDADFKKVEKLLSAQAKQNSRVNNRTKNSLKNSSKTDKNKKS